jgi:epoxyqueuosine reductase QueG
MNEIVTKVCRTLGIPFGICSFNDLHPLIETRSKNRLPSNAKCVIVFLLSYYAGECENSNVARYAWADDYHVLAKKILDPICGELKVKFPNDEFVSFADSSPIPEVKAAYLAGLGSIGQNGLLINMTYGSHTLICEIVTSVDIHGNSVYTRVCTDCGKCKLTCPTGALTSHGFDKTLCRSFITQKKGVLNEFEKMQVSLGKSAWGCDLCTDVCPCNTRLTTPLELFKTNLEPVIREENIDTLVASKSYGWRGKDVILRNLKLI